MSFPVNEDKVRYFPLAVHVAYGIKSIFKMLLIFPQT